MSVDALLNSRGNGLCDTTLLYTAVLVLSVPLDLVKLSIDARADHMCAAYHSVPDPVARPPYIAAGPVGNGL
eukprot:4701173-Prymnesium_polylepis.1